MDVGAVEGHTARFVQPVQARKDYVCPSCGNPIGAGEGHVVAWPDDQPDLRRHWHRHCWRLAVRRGRLG